MPERTASLPPGEPDPALLEKLAALQQACLLVVALMALIVFAGWLFPPIMAYLPVAVTRMSIPMSLTVLLCALSLAISESGNHLSLPRASRYIAAQAGLLSILILLESTFRLSRRWTLLEADRAPGNTGGLPVHSPAAFVLLSVAMILVERHGIIVAANRRWTGPAGVPCHYGSVEREPLWCDRLLRLSANNMISPLLLMCLVLLTFVVAMRQAERGVWSIFVGAGIGSRIARAFRTSAATDSLPH